MGVWWPKDGSRNPFWSMFANRSSVVSEVVCPTEQCRAGKPACLASSNQWQRGIESSTLLPSNLRYQLHQTSSHQDNRSSPLGTSNEKIRWSQHTRLLLRHGQETCCEMPRLITRTRRPQCHDGSVSLHTVHFNARARHHATSIESSPQSSSPSSIL